MMMKSHGRRYAVYAAVLVAVTGLVPIVWYWFMIGRAPAVDAAVAKKMLGEGGPRVVLVDVRDPAEFEASHLEGAKNWPYQKIMSLENAHDMPASLTGRTLLLICDSGISSAFAARRLASLSITNVFNVRGGMEAWTGSMSQPCQLRFCRLTTGAGKTSALPFRPASLLEQWAACVTAFGVKPLYMLTSFALIVVLWRKDSPDLAALRWGFIFFLAGESFCALNYLFLGEDSFLVEYLHSFGMVAAFGFTAWAVFEGVDSRIIRWSNAEKKCAALSLCGPCIKNAPVPCGLRRLFMLMIPMVMIVGVMPLLASPHPVSYNTDIMGTAYNYSHPVIYQLFEVRYLPVMAEIFLAASLQVLSRKKDRLDLAKLFFAAGVGCLGFCFFRFFLFSAYRDNLAWYVAWEEVTELMYVAGAGIILWIFKRSLLDRKPLSRPAAAPDAGADD